MTEQSLGRKIAKAMITILIFQVFLKFGGMIIRLLSMNYFGRNNLAALDALTFAETTIIWPLYVIFEKIVTPTFIPLFSEERALRGEEPAWRFANSFGTALAAALAVAVAVLIFNAESIVIFLASGWAKENPQTAVMAARFVRWMAPALFFLGMGSFTYSLLNCHKRFSYAAAGAAIQRFAQALIFFVALWLFNANAIWAALAFVIASPVKLVTHFIGLRDKLKNLKAAAGHFRPVLRPALRWGGECCIVGGAVFFFEPSKALYAIPAFLILRGLFSWFRIRGVAEKSLMQKLYLLGYPVLLGVGIAWARDLVQDSYATRLDPGIFSAIKFAKNFVDVPTAFIPLALSLAMFPFLCDMFTKQDISALSGVVSKSIKMAALFFLPLTAVLFVLSAPAIGLMISNKVSQPLVTAASFALAIYALGLVFYTLEMVLMQVFFSLQNTWLPTVVGAAASFGQIGFLYLAFAMMKNPDNKLASLGLTPFIVVVMAYPVSRAAKNLVLGAILQKKLGLFSGRDVYRFLPQVLLLTAASGSAAWLTLQQLGELPASFIGKGLKLGVPAFAGAIAMFALLFVFAKIKWQVEEFTLMTNWLRETGWQKIRSKIRGKNDS